MHVNRAPVAGKVVDYFVADGGFINAMKPDAEHSVAAYTVLETGHGAGWWRSDRADRPTDRAAGADRSLLARGERFGLIRFGSRTDVYLPAEAAEPLVGPGDR
jgi:phosphatidylserine decarboxylase